jgi:hypothetical protein
MGLLAGSVLFGGSVDSVGPLGLVVLGLGVVMGWVLVVAFGLLFLAAGLASLGRRERGALAREERLVPFSEDEVDATIDALQCLIRHDLSSPLPGEQLQRCLVFRPDAHHWIDRQETIYVAMLREPGHFFGDQFGIEPVEIVARLDDLSFGNLEAVHGNGVIG